MSILRQESTDCANEGRKFSYVSTEKLAEYAKRIPIGIFDKGIEGVVNEWNRVGWLIEVVQKKQRSRVYTDLGMLARPDGFISDFKGNIRD